MDANTRPSTFTLLRAALIAGTIFLLPTPGDAPMDAAVDDMFLSAPSSVHPLVSSLPPPNVGSEVADNAAVVIGTSVDTFVNATVTLTGSRLPAIAVEILKDLTGIVLENAIVYCSVLAASVLVAIFLSFRRFVTVAPTRLGVRLSARRRQFICLLWFVLEAIRCHLGRNTMLEDEITRLRPELNEVTLRLATAGAEPAGLKTLDEDSLPLTTADTEQQTEACMESQPSIIASLCLDTTNSDTVSTKVSDDEQNRTSEKSITLDKSTMTGTQELDETTPYLVAARQTNEASLPPKTVMLEKEQNVVSREARQAAQMEIYGLRELVQSLESRLHATVNTLEETTLAKQVVEQDMALQTQTLTKDVEKLALGLQYAEGQAMEWQRRAKDSEARLEEEKAVVRRESQRADVAERKMEDTQTGMDALSEELVAAKAQIVESHAHAEDLEVQLRNEILQGKKGRRREDRAKLGLRKAWSQIGALSMKLKDEQAKVCEVEALISESQAKASLLKSAIEDERRSAELLSEESRGTTGTLTMALMEEQTKVREVEALLAESQAKASLLKSTIEDERERGDSANLLLDEAHRTIETLSTALTEEQTKVREVEAQVSESQAKAFLLKSALGDEMERRNSAILLLEEAHGTIGTLSNALTEEQTKVREVEALLIESQAKASGLDSALAKANRWTELARVKMITQAKDLEILQCQVATAQSALEDETLRADLTAAMFARSNESFVLLKKAVEEDKRRADDAEQRMEEVRHWIDKFLEVVEAEKKEIAEANVTEIRRSQQVVTALQASLQAETERANSAEDKISAIQQEMDGLMKGPKEEMRSGYEMQVKLDDADSQAARAYQERQALALDLDATNGNPLIAQQKIKALSESCQELERQLQMTREDNKRLADATRRAHFDANVAKEELQTISASTRDARVWRLTQKDEFSEKENRMTEGRVKSSQKLLKFYSTTNKQLLRTMKIQKCAMEAEVRQAKARLETVTKKAIKLAKGKAIQEKHRVPRKLSYRFKPQQILDRYRSTGSAARRKVSPMTLPTTKIFETAKTEDEHKTTLLGHPSMSAPTPESTSLCESPLQSHFETRGLGDIVDMTDVSVSADELCIPECPTPSDDLPRGPDDREPSGLPELPEVSYTASFTTLETIPAWSPLEIVHPEDQLSVAEASESVVLLSGSDLPDLPSFPSGSVSWSRSLSRHGCAQVLEAGAQVLEAGTLEASESVVLLSGSTLSDLPSFPSGTVSWSRSLPRTGLPATGVTRATDYAPVQSTPERALLPPSLVFPDSLGSCVDDIVSAASIMHDSPSNTSLSALPARSPHQLLTDPRVAARAGMEAMLRAQRREQQHCLSPTPGSRAVSYSVKDSMPTSCSPVISASVLDVSQHARRPSMDSELSLMEFDVSFNVLTSTPRKGSGLQQMTMAESSSVGELEMSALDMYSSFPVPVLSLPHVVDAILPDYLVLPSVPVLTWSLEDSGSECSVLVPSLSVAPEADLTRGAASESSLTENEAPVALPLANLLPANENVPSSSGGRTNQTPATALASVLVGHMADKCDDGGELDCEGRMRDARTLKFRKRSLEALQSRRIVSHRIGSRLPDQ